MLQTSLKSLTPEMQQGVLKEWTAMYQKSGITYNQFLASIQQKQAHRQVHMLLAKSTVQRHGAMLRSQSAGQRC